MTSRLRLTKLVLAAPPFVLIPGFDGPLIVVAGFVWSSGAVAGAVYQPGPEAAQVSPE